jgi:hypothetical protein
MPRQQSIFENDGLLDNFDLIIKIAQANNYELALKMLNDLGKDRFMTLGPTSKEPTPQDLNTLDAFIAWLAKNNVRDPNGITLSWGPMPQGSNVAANTIAYKSDNPAGIFQITSADGIIKSLQELEQMAKTSNNMFLQELIDNLLEQAMNSNKLKIDANNFELGKNTTTQPEQGQKSEQGQSQSTSGEKQPGAEQVSYQENKPQQMQQNVIQQILGPEGLVLPFDIDQDQVNVRLMTQFIEGLIKLTQAPQLKNELQYQNEMITNSINTAMANFQAWNTSATPNAKAGFDLGDIYNIEPFVNTYANSSYEVARNMMNKMITLCNSIMTILGILRASPTIMNILGQNRLLKQLEQGKAFIDKMQNMYARFQNAMKK